MDKLNLESIIKSFFLGGFIGLVLQVSLLDQLSFRERVMMILISAAIGFIIGFITEVITALLPISIAKHWTYFLINSLISLIITAIILYLTVYISSNDQRSTQNIPLVISIALVIVFFANMIDFILYLRVQRRLINYKESLNQQLGE